jgi:cell division protein FtsW (lipid II flippase)
MAIGTGSVAIMVAIGFVVLGLAGLPITKFFLLGAVVVGIGIATVFHFNEKKPLFPKRFF